MVLDRAYGFEFRVFIWYRVQGFVVLWVEGLRVPHTSRMIQWRVQATWA